MEWSSRNMYRQIKENYWQNLLLRTDILQKTVVGCPTRTVKNNNRSNCSTIFVHFLAVVSQTCDERRNLKIYLLRTHFGSSLLSFRKYSKR